MKSDAPGSLHSALSSKYQHGSTNAVFRLRHAGNLPKGKIPYRSLNPHPLPENFILEVGQPLNLGVEHAIHYSTAYDKRKEIVDCVEQARAQGWTYWDACRGHGYSRILHSPHLHSRLPLRFFVIIVVSSEVAISVVIFNLIGSY